MTRPNRGRTAESRGCWSLVRSYMELARENHDDRREEWVQEAHIWSNNARAADRKTSQALERFPARCGETQFDAESEARTQAIRAANGFSSEGGCGGVLIFADAYRCVECGRWLHRKCAERHFATHGDLVAKLRADFAALRLELATFKAGKEWDRRNIVGRLQADLAALVPLARAGIQAEFEYGPRVGPQAVEAAQRVLADYDKGEG